MRVSNIDIANVLGVQEATVVAHRPVLFFAGSNGAGKSSMAEAVRLAFSGEKSRGVDHKKDLGQLLHGEAPAGCVEIAFAEGGVASYVLPQGTHSRPSFLDNEALPYVIEPSRFAALDAQGRRALILKLMGVEITRATVRNRLAGRNCNEEKAGMVTPLLSAGFDAAQKEAQGKGREAKAAWRTVTGEAYGEKKAEGWKAEAPEVDAQDITGAEAAVAHFDAAIEEASQALGAAQAAVAKAGNAMRRRAELQEKAGKRERIVAKLETDRASLTEAEAKVAAAKAAAAAPTTYPCPDCGVLLAIKGGVLVHVEPGEAGDKEAAEKLPAYEKALTLCRSMVQNDERDLAAADAAADELAKMGDPVAAADEAAVLAAKGKVEELRNKRNGAHDQLLQLREAQRKAGEAANKTAQATKYHADVQEWDAIAAALAPDCIPAEFLAEAMLPFNKELSEASELAGWPVVQLDDGMTITMGGREYRFRSESEKWRADALIASVIANLSGLKFLLLDRFDVLDMQGRGEAMYWLNDLAEQYGIGALVFGTLKALPAALPENIQGEWIDGGRVMSAAA